jgi:hypothetical protein
MSAQSHDRTAIRSGLLALVFLVAAAVPAAAQTPTARPADVASIDAILTVLYDVISGPAGAPRDWDRFRSLFAPGARLIPVRRTPDGGATPGVMTPDEFAATAGPRFQELGFFEREIGRTLDEFGHIAHVMSAYESRRTATEPDPSLGRGINSIQLLRDGNRWWVVTIFWDSERAENPIPAKYLAGRETGPATSP